MIGQDLTIPSAAILPENLDPHNQSIASLKRYSQVKLQDAMISQNVKEFATKFGIPCQQREKAIIISRNGDFNGQRAQTALSGKRGIRLR